YLLIRPLREYALGRGGLVFCEHPIKVGTKTAYVDLLILLAGLKFHCEAEASCHRVCNDLLKANANRADGLLIVTANLSIANACRRQLRRCPDLPTSSVSDIAVCTLGAAIAKIASVFESQSVLSERGERPIGTSTKRGPE
ncbi:MAG: hypothetical protein O2960_30815, partial [Verrucomicrobia bacterium]|nr:hypothetical protein [Verrucomicrobiota bacterium]